jgi:selenide,water dikinase
MLTAAEVHARLYLSDLPSLPGARELAGAGWSATGSSALETYLRQVNIEADPEQVATELALLLDPQTSGGLLAALPPETAAGRQKRNPAAGPGFHIIGEVVESSFQSPRVTLEDGSRA